MAARVGVPTARVDTYAFALRLGHRRARRLRAVADRQRRPGPRPELHRRFVHGRRAGRRRAARRHRVRGARASASSTSSLEAWSGAVLAKIAVLVFIVVFIQKRPQGLFALKGRMAEGVSRPNVAVNADDRTPPLPQRHGAMLARARPPRAVLPARAGWVALTASSPSSCCVLVPIAATWCCRTSSVFHLSDYVVTLIGKIMCYAIVALAMDLIWGYTGILSLGHGALLRARRLRDGHVPDALDRPRRRLPQRPARLHGVPRLEGLSLVLELHRPLLVRGAARGAGARRARVRVRLLRLPLAHQGRVFLDHHAGDDLRVDAAVLPQRDRLRRQQRLHRLQAHPRAFRSRRRRRGWCCSSPPACALLGASRCSARHRDVEARARADGDPRRRERA